jgi:hypothetical protein
VARETQRLALGRIGCFGPFLGREASVNGSNIDETYDPAEAGDDMLRHTLEWRLARCAGRRNT